MVTQGSLAYPRITDVEPRVPRGSSLCVRVGDLVNEAGVSGCGAMDVVRIWVPAWNQGAVFSPDGMTIQFDSGTI